MQYWRNNWQLWTWSIHFIFLTDMCSFCWQKREPRPKLFLRLDISSTFRRVHTLIFTYVPYVVIGLHEEPAPQTYTHQQKGNCLPNDLCPSHLHPTQRFFNSHHDECTSFLITQLSKNKIKFIPKVLKVHINWIQLYLYSASLRNQYKLKP